MRERLGEIFGQVSAYVMDLRNQPERLVPVAAGLLVLNLVALSAGGPTEQVETDRGQTADGLEPGELLPGEALPGGLGEDGTVPGSPGARTSGRRGSSSSGGGGGAAAPPVTDSEIKVGIPYLQDPGTANQAAGFAGIGQVDQRRGWEAMIKEVNKKPPHGRKVVPVWYPFTTNDVVSKGSSQMAQEQCALWTRDDPVFVVWSSGTDELRACLTKGGVAQIGGGLGFSYDQTWKDYPYLVEHNSSALDRMAEFHVDQLVAKGFFSKCKNHPSTDPCVDGKPRIGLIRYDWPSYKAGAARMKKALAAHGLALCSGCEFEISYSNDNIPAMLDDATEVNNAINNCRTAKTVPAPGDTSTPPGPCTHMLFLGSTQGVRITLFYVQRAEDQGYRARLGFNTLDGPAAVRDFYAGQGQGEKYNNQFTNSLLVSYSPGDFDLRPDGFKDCMKLWTDAGETFGGSDDSAGNKKNQIDGYCDTAWYHSAAFNAAGQTVNLDTWLKGVANTGFIKSAGSFLMRTTATRHDGASAIRIGDWDAGGDCKCWKPVTGDIPV